MVHLLGKQIRSEQTPNAPESNLSVWIPLDLPNLAFFTWYGLQLIKLLCEEEHVIDFSVIFGGNDEHLVYTPRN